MPSKYLEKVMKNIPKDSHLFAAKSLDIVDRVHVILQQKSLTQRDLAQRMGKSESEISKILSPGYNMTLKMLVKLEAALETSILVVADGNSPIQYDQNMPNVGMAAETKPKYGK